MTAQTEARGTGNLVVSFGWCNWSSRKPCASLTRNTCLSTWLDQLFLFPFFFFFFATATLYRRSVLWNIEILKSRLKNYHIGITLVKIIRTLYSRDGDVNPEIVDNWDPSVNYVNYTALARTNWRWYLGAVAEGAALLMTPRGRLATLWSKLMEFNRPLTAQLWGIISPAILRELKLRAFASCRDIYRPIEVTDTIYFPFWAL